MAKYPLATPCKNCGHPLGVHDNGGDSRVVRVCITCRCDRYEPGTELANPGRVQIVDCKATLPEPNGASLQCDGRHNEEGHHGQDDPAGTGRINWTESVAVYPFNEGPVGNGPARDRQVGGEHYRKHVIQHWDIAVEYRLNYFEGAILKYLLRDKGNRLEDLKKARHTLDKLIEIEEAKER